MANPHPQFGRAAEEVIAPERAVTRRPRSLSFEEEAAVPLAGLTASQFVVGALDLHAGEKVAAVVEWVGGEALADASTSTLSHRRRAPQVRAGPHPTLLAGPPRMDALQLLRRIRCSRSRVL